MKSTLLSLRISRIVFRSRYHNLLTKNVPTTRVKCSYNSSLTINSSDFNISSIDPLKCSVIPISEKNVIRNSSLISQAQMEEFVMRAHGKDMSARQEYFSMLSDMLTDAHFKPNYHHFRTAFYVSFISIRKNQNKIVNDNALHVATDIDRLFDEMIRRKICPDIHILTLSLKISRVLSHERLFGQLDLFQKFSVTPNDSIVELLVSVLPKSNEVSVKTVQQICNILDFMKQYRMKISPNLEFFLRYKGLTSVFMRAASERNVKCSITKDLTAVRRCLRELMIECLNGNVYAGKQCFLMYKETRENPWYDQLGYETFCVVMENCANLAVNGVSGAIEKCDEIFENMIADRINPDAKVLAFLMNSKSVSSYDAALSTVAEFKRYRVDLDEHSISALMRSLSSDIHKKRLEWGTIKVSDKLKEIIGTGITELLELTNVRTVLTFIVKICRRNEWSRRAPQ